MKKIMPLCASIMLILVAGMFAGAGTLAQFYDTEEVGENTFTAGILDLKVNDVDNPTIKWTSDLMEPGDEYLSEVLTLKNAGNVDGKLTVTITNLFCRENGLEEPEIAAGDVAGVQLDPDGFSQEGGSGELWDQVLFKIWIDRNGDGQIDWHDKPTLSLYPDESGYYSVPVGSPIVLDDDFDPSETLGFAIEIDFLDDTWEDYGWILDGVPNNAAMGDSIEMDLVFDLTQT